MRREVRDWIEMTSEDDMGSSFFFFLAGWRLEFVISLELLAFIDILPVFILRERYSERTDHTSDLLVSLSIRSHGNLVECKAWQ